ncbi:MAG: undecaprenyl-diphosphate phosphatase [Candidatus Heimdallarchaeota archaeon]|nr:undecaprenyl-diphosphate phosphatase [Candidatus Heimdallarchaeota archaeon]MBY8993323.1 undecaprenyl-diphosphate phosphatase [Candidatus Heimdallarchaeota archaeon]
MVGIGLIILLAIVQGLLEWLPVSSEGQIFLILNWFGDPTNALSIALFLHIGTMLAVLVRFRKDFLLLFNIKFRKKKKNEISEEQLDEEEEQTEEEKLAESEKRKILWKFLLIATAGTALIGIPLLVVIRYALEEGALYFANGRLAGGEIITLVIGVFLIATGIFILVSKRKTAKKTLYEMKNWEMLVVGLTQGLAIIPGISRSGTTIGTMLIEGVNEEESLRGSFLLSIPAVIGGNILIIIIDLIQGETSFVGIPWYGMLLGVVISAIVGFVTIDLFLRLAKKVNFGWFCITIGALALVITLIIIILALTTTV